MGYVDEVNVPHPTHLRLRKRTWRSTGGVYLRSTTFTRDHRGICLWTPAARPCGHPRGHHDPIPHAPCHSRASVSVPWIPPDSRTSTWPSLAAPPAPRTHGAHRISGLAGGASELRQCKGVAADDAAATDVPVVGRMSGPLARWLLMVRGSWVVYYARYPDHQQPSRKCPRCFSTTASVKINLLTA